MPAVHRHAARPAADKSAGPRVARRSSVPAVIRESTVPPAVRGSTLPPFIREPTGHPAARGPAVRSAVRAPAAAGAALAAGLAGGLCPAPAPGQTVDTSRWECEFCAFPTGWHGDFSLGSGYVTDDSAKFGDFTGLEEDGAFLVGGIDVRYLGERGNEWSLEAVDLGLDSRSLRLTGGRPDGFGFELSYDELPKYLFDTTVSPFRGAGDTPLTLPAGWVPAGSTRAMTELTQSLLPIDIEHERQTFGLGIELVRSAKLEYSAEFRHRERDGTQIFGGSFSGVSALLPAPIDYVTDELELAVVYATERSELRAAYFGSFFSSKDVAVIWENPFAALVPGADQGRAALPPDNSFQSISVGGSYRLHPTTIATGNVALGRGDQDDDFLAYTINSEIPTTPLPRESLDGRIDTVNVDARIVSTPLSRLRLTAGYAYDERDNDTERALYELVEADSFASAARLNVPYSFERYRYKMQADYRIRRRARLYVGGEREVVRRDFQEVDRTEEDTFWTRLRVFNFGFGEGSVKLARAERDSSEYRPLTGFGRPQNPLLRKFNLTDRERDFAELDIALTPLARLGIGIGARITDDSYDETVLGLTDGESRGYRADLSIGLPGDGSVYALFDREEIEAEQTGSERFAAPDWFAVSEDETVTAGVGIELRNIGERVDLGLDYSYSESTGSIDLTTAAPAIVPFPDFETRLNSIRLRLRYRTQERWAFQAGVHYERYRSDDWALDGVAPATILNVLTLGAESYNYDVTVLSLSFTYDLANDGG